MELNIYKQGEEMKFSDRSGPRFNTRTFRHKIITRDLYKAWKKKTGYKISFDEFKRIWKLLALEIHSGILEEPNGVMLPYGMGELYLGWVTTKLKGIDYKTSREIGRLVYYENYHSYGKVGKLIYHACAKYSLYTCRMWNFKPITPLINKVSKAFMDRPEIYKNSRQKKFYINNNGNTSSGGTTDISSNEPTQDG